MRHPNEGHPNVGHPKVGQSLDCEIPIEERRPIFEPRCRPWYQYAHMYPNTAVIVTYLSLDKTEFYVAISKALIDRSNGEVLGVEGIDLSQESIHDIMEQTKESIQNANSVFFMTHNTFVIYQYDYI